MRARNEAGFTLIEMMVAIGVFAVASTAFYQLLFSSTRGSERAQAVINVSEEARLGFNRIVRDTREASRVLTPSATSFRIQVDFNGNNAIDDPPSDPTGSYEDVMFSFNQALETITITPCNPANLTTCTGSASELLMRGAQCIPKPPPGGCHDVFTFASSRLEWDTNLDGRTSAVELNAAPTIGDGDPDATLDGPELDFVDVVTFALRVRQGATNANFYAEAQLRNRR